jgi:hypothetical protein
LMEAKINVDLRDNTNSTALIYGKIK